LLDHPADRGDHVDALAFGTRLIGRPVEAQSGASTDLLHLAFIEDVGRNFVRRGHTARLGFGTRSFDLPRNLALKIGPGLLADLALGTMRLELGQRIARPFGLDLSLALVGLRILETVPFEPRHGQPQQRWSALGPDMPDGFRDQPRSLDRLGSVTVED